MSAEVIYPAAAPAASAVANGASVAGASLRFRPFLAIVCLFWLYATVSAVLYVYGLDASFQGMTGKVLFASWRARVLQYLFLLPPLLGCYWFSLRLGWQPLRRRLAPQLALALVFAILASPALWIAVAVLGEDKAPGMEEHTWSTLMWDIRKEMSSTWLASTTDFEVRYGFGLALVTGFAMYKRYRDSETRVGALERQWSAARLAALRMQLSPHTLFNLLHTIRGQIAWDPAAAQTMVVQLADLLRRLLNAGERDFSRLADEVQFVRLYLELQRSRFPERLVLSLPDGTALPALWVPSLILQPLVENAVKHGLAGHDGQISIEVEAAVAGDVLRLTVTNGMAPGAVGREGIGLRNVRERLAVQFGERARFSAGPVAASWVAVIELPVLRDTPPPRMDG